MPHAPGWTLCTARVAFSNNDTADICQMVLHYDVTGVAMTPAAVEAVSFAFDAAFTPLWTPNANINWQYDGVDVNVNDGVTEILGATFNFIPGTLEGTDLPQVMCAILRKRCASLGRRRFGHSCWPGLDSTMTSDPNTLTDAFVASLTAAAAVLNSGPGMTGVAGSSHVIYHADLDTRDPVYSFIASPDLRSNRHRTPGRGM